MTDGDHQAEENLQRCGPRGRALDRRRGTGAGGGGPLPDVPGEMVTGEPEPASELLESWRILRKRRWSLLTILVVTLVVVLLGTLQQKPLYRAKALLEIEEENPDILSVQELFRLENVSDTYLETQYRILESESLARRVVDQLRLDRLREFNQSGYRLWSLEEDREAAATRAAPGRREQIFAVGEAAVPRDPVAYQNTLDTFQERLAVAPIKRSRLVRVSFEAQDPERAARIVNTLAANYIEQAFERRWEATQKASEWLSEQLLELKANLENSEQELQAYARRNGLLFLESEQGSQENIVNERLGQLQEELTRAETDRMRKEALYQLTQSGDFGALPGIFENKLMQDLTVELAKLRREYARMVTTFSDHYPAVKRLRNQIDELEELLERERARAAERIRNDYEGAVKREALLQRAFRAQRRQADRVAEKSVQYNILKREVETNKELYEGLLQRLKEAGMSAGMKASHVRVIDPALPPESPAKPNVVLNLVLALVVGFGLGVGVVFVQERFDNTLKSAEDVERFLRLPVLGLVPSLDSLNGTRRRGNGWRGPRRLLPATRAGSPAPVWKVGRGGGEQESSSKLAEAFRSLRTSVLLSTPEQAPRLLVASSAQPGEGKTTVTVNLAASLAQLGQHVLLIDADLRRPCVHKAFALASGRGLVGYLTGQQDWEAVVQASSVPGLDLLVAGPIPPNPAELLSSDRLRRMLEEAHDRYDFVLLDSPPLLNVADGRILAALAEGMVLVVHGGATPRELARRAYLQAREVGANIIGVVLNNIDLRRDDYYYYARYYRYDYYASDPGEPRVD